MNLNKIKTIFAGISTFTCGSLLFIISFLYCTLAYNVITLTRDYGLCLSYYTFSSLIIAVFFFYDCYYFAQKQYEKLYRLRKHAKYVYFFLAVPIFLSSFYFLFCMGYGVDLFYPYLFWCFIYAGISFSYLSYFFISVYRIKCGKIDKNDAIPELKIIMKGSVTFSSIVSYLPTLSEKISENSGIFFTVILIMFLITDFILSLVESSYDKE